MTELDALMEQLGRHGFLLYSFRSDRHGPEVLAAVLDFGGVADVAILVDEQRAMAYRTPSGHGLDVFAPRHAFWSYASSPVWTLRALLTLAPPGHPDAPREISDAPPGLGLQTEGRMPVQVRKRER